MQAQAEPVDGGKSCNSIHYGQFNQYPLRNPRFADQHCASNAFTRTTRANTSATHPQEAPILPLSIASTATQAWKVVTVLPQRPQKQATATRPNCHAQWRHPHSQAPAPTTEATAPGQVRQLVSGESHRRLETRSALLVQFSTSKISGGCPNIGQSPLLFFSANQLTKDS